MFGKVGRQRSNEECRSADPVEDEISMHTDAARSDFAVPVSCTLEFVEAIFQGILVVRAIRNSIWGKNLSGLRARLRDVVRLSGDDQVINFVLKDLVVVRILESRS